MLCAPYAAQFRVTNVVYVYIYIHTDGYSVPGIVQRDMSPCRAPQPAVALGIYRRCPKKAKQEGDTVQQYIYMYTHTRYKQTFLTSNIMWAKDNAQHTQ